MKKNITLIIKCFAIVLLLGFVLPSIVKRVVFKYNKRIEKNNAIFVVNYGIEDNSILYKLKNLIK